MNFLTKILGVGNLHGLPVYDMVEHIAVMDFGNYGRDYGSSVNRAMGFASELLRHEPDTAWSLAMLGYHKGTLYLRWFYNAPSSCLKIDDFDSYDGDWWSVGEHGILKDEFWQKYHAAYMASEQWARKADEARIRYGYRCALCNASDFINVHHRTYERLGRESLDDLTVLCRDCHAKFHNQ
jgi:hypothetical protein